MKAVGRIVGIQKKKSLKWTDNCRRVVGCRRWPDGEIFEFIGEANF